MEEEDKVQCLEEQRVQLKLQFPKMYVFIISSDFVCSLIFRHRSICEDEFYGMSQNYLHSCNSLCSRSYTVKVLKRSFVQMKHLLLIVE